MIYNRLCRRILFLTLLVSLTVLLLLSFISCANSADTSVPNANETTDNGFSIEESESIRVETDRDGSVIRLYVDRENRGIDLEAIASSKQTFTVTDSKGELIPNNVIVAEESGASFTVYYGMDKTPYRLTVYFNEYCNLTFEGVETVIKVLKGETVKSPNTKPTKIGHIFVGWDFDFSEAVTADAHINAKWKPSTYTITFDANGGKLDSSSMIVTFGENVLLPLPVMSGYVFIGWHDGTKVVDSGVWSIDQNVVLKAMWDHHDYKVTYDPNGGTVDKTLQGVSYGDPFVSPIPKREGFTFLGWFCDGVLIDNTSYAYQEDKVFVAEWKLNTYNVTFESNGGSPIESGEYLYSEIKQVIPARDGYTFGGWFFDIGLTLTDTDVSSDNHVTVYAWWTEEDKPSYYHYELHDSGAIILGYEQRSYAAVIPSYIGGKNVVAIGDHAFENCKNITSVVLPKSISRIGEYAFYGCDSLIAFNSLGIDGGYTVSSFEGIKEIGKYAFSECAFEKIVSCDSISTLSDGIFENCKDLVSIQLGKPDKIGNSVFCGCEKLESVNLSGNATVIGENVFKDCIGLNSVTLPDKLEKIGNQAFNGCVSLVSMTLPKSVTVIGDGAFQGCFSLSDLANFMSLRGLKSIGAYAFSGCEKLSGIGILPSVNKIGVYAF